MDRSARSRSRSTPWSWASPAPTVSLSCIDEEPEADEGYVTLVNAQVNPDTWQLEEADHHTGMWAWKHPHRATGEIEYVPLRGDLVMDNVDFGYTPDHEVLHGVSVFAKPGQKVAFVGATGAGKTTITNLINRFYDIADGKIRYDGINVNKIRKADLRRSLGVVLQDVNLFTGTVMDNIRYGNLDATDEECIAAAKLAGADDFITRLPDGYDTMLTGNGAQLSQGQRQLISIARAAVADPPAMILDEATCVHRYPHRGHRAGRHGQAHGGPHDVCHRAPPVHRAQLRRNHLSGPRPHYRARQPRRADRQARVLLPALYRSV